MLIGLDYDRTFTKDPAFWRLFVKLLRARGHDAVMVTYRGRFPAGAEVIRAIGGLMPIIFTDGKQKRPAALRRGYHVDIWIDDMPELIP